MDEPQEHMSQAEFARHCGVSRAAVSQWKTNNILRDDAFTKPDKKGKLIVAIALDQVNRFRDIGQSLGNGIATKTAAQSQPAKEVATTLPLEPTEAPDPKVAEPVPTSSVKSTGEDLPRSETVEDKMKAARLEEQLRRNRMKASEEAVLRGQLMVTGDARGQMTQVAGLMLQVFEGALPDFSAKLAEQFSVPQRDVLHLLKAEYLKVRAQGVKKARLTVEKLNKIDEVTVEDDSKK